MNDGKDKLKLIGIGALIVIALGALAFNFSRNVGTEKENVVGELPMPAGGGRDAEGGVVVP